MPDIISVFILVCCSCLLVLYKKTKSYISFKGLGLAFLFLLSLFLTFLSSSRQELGFNLDNLSKGFLPITIFVFFTASILFSMRHKSKKFKVLPWLLSLFTFYLLFGVIQQTFFLAIFTHTLNRVLEDKTLVIIFSSVFFSTFHWSWSPYGIKFGMLTLLAGVVNSLLYLSGTSIIILGFGHALIASLYYFIIYENNILEKRLSLKKIGLAKLIHH